MFRENPHLLGKGLRLLVVSAIVVCTAIGGGLAQDKVRIAVVDFDTTPIHGSWRYGWSYNRLATAAADNLTNKLVQTGKFSVIERQKLDKVLAEQNLGASGRLNPSTAADLGKVLGVQLIVIGTVTQFGIKEQGGSLGSVGRKVFGRSVGAKVVTGEIALSARLVDTTSAEILGAWDADDKHSFGKGRVGSNSLGTNWDSGMASDLLAEAVTDLASHIASASSSLTPSDLRGDIEGKIAQVSGASIYINVGEADGIKPGDRFEVRALGDEIIDPDTGQSLGAMEETIGSIEVTKIVNDNLSVARPVEGTGFAVGNRILLQ
jgi:curli biogenesis system outer membrane secretion channel CsgG